MSAVLEIVLPVFGLVLCGYLMGRTRFFPEAAVRGIVNFVFYLAIPALLFRALARTVGAGGLDARLLYAYYGPCVLVFFLVMAGSRLLLRSSPEEQALAGLSAVFSNLVLLGIPLMFTGFGEAAVVPLMLIISIQSMLLITLATVMVEIGRGRAGDGPSLAVIGRTLTALASNPIILAVVAGAAWGALHLPMPAALSRFLDLLAGAAPPAALFALGATLTAFRIGGDLREGAAITAVKLLLMPAVVWLVTHELFAFDPVYVAVATVAAAMPTGANAFILARQYDIYVARSAAAILLGTAGSVVTASALVAWFRSQGIGG